MNGDDALCDAQRYRALKARMITFGNFVEVSLNDSECVPINLSRLSPDELTRLETKASHFEMCVYAEALRLPGISEEERRTLEIDFPVFCGPLRDPIDLDIRAELAPGLPNKDGQ